MRAACFILTATLAFAATAPADEPHLEMIRGLRAAGEPELALQYIEQRLPKDLPPALAQVVGLELARTRAELARAEGEEAKRLGLYAAARAEFGKFLKANPDHELAAQARFEIARLAAAQGKEAVNRARRAEGAARARALRDARPAFEEAGRQLAEAAQRLKAQRDALGEPDTPDRKALARDLTQSWLLARLEEGINLYQLAQTYADDVKKRAELMGEAAGAFERLMGVDVQQPVCWLARAWLARAYFENDDFGKAAEQLDAITAARGPHVDDARRVAAYFRVLMGRRDGAPARLTPAQQQTQLQQWLERYGARYRDTPEGCGARYYLAEALAEQAYDKQRGGIKLDAKGRPVSVTQDAAIKVRQAERLLRGLTETENDFTDRAAAKRMGLILAIAIREAPDRDPAKLDSFERCYLLALLEVAELNEELKEEAVAQDPEKAAAVRRKHYQRAARALNRGVTLVKPSDPPREVLDARLLQVYAHLVTGDHAGAAALGEALAKQMTRTSRGAVPALYALQAHREQLLEARAAAREADARAHDAQVRRLAAFMEATWPDAPTTDTARHTLGALDAAAGDYVRALEVFARVTPNYAALARLRHEQGAACFNLQKAPNVPAAVKKQWLDRVVAELDRLPDPGPGSAADAAHAYLLARLQLGHLLLLEGKQYPRVEQLGKAVMEQGPKYLTGERAAEIKYGGQALMLYGLYGRVYEHVKAHNDAEAARLYQPALAELKKDPVPDTEPAARARKAAADLLQLALRSSVQAGDIDRAQEVLKQLEQVSGGTGDSGPLVAVLKEVQQQIADLRRNDPARLAEVVDKFTNFLEALAKQQSATRDVKIFLAQGFAALDRPARAIELLTSIPEPKEKDPGPAPKAPPEGATDAQREQYEAEHARHEAARAAYEAAWRPYWFAQLTRARALRQAGRLAQDKGEKEKYFGSAERLLDEMIGTAPKPGWAFNSLEVRREKIFILEDREQYRAALDAWVAMQRPFARFGTPPKDDKEARSRALFYEVRFYMTRLVFRSKQKIKDAKRREFEIRKLAEQIVEQEKDPRTSDFGGDHVRRLYQAWLAEEPQMRQAYEAAQGKALLPAGADAAGS